MLPSLLLLLLLLLLMLSQWAFHCQLSLVDGLLDLGVTV